MKENKTQDEAKFLGFDLRSLHEVLTPAEIETLQQLNDKAVAARKELGQEVRPAFIVSSDMPWYEAVRALIDSFRKAYEDMGSELVKLYAEELDSDELAEEKELS